MKNNDDDVIKFHKEEKYNKKFEEMKDEMYNNEVGEDETKYGVFFSSYFEWIPLPKQKERAEELDKMTKKNRRE